MLSLSVKIASQKILFFLIGFCIVVIPFGIAHSGDEWTWPVGGFESQPENYDGHYRNYVNANNALYDAHPFIQWKQSVAGCYLTPGSELYGSGCWRAVVAYYPSGTENFYACWDSQYTGPEGMPSLDSDGDGIPDKDDLDSKNTERKDFGVNQNRKNLNACEGMVGS